MIINYDIETCSDLVPLGEVPIHDSWDEPTDGTYLITKKDKDIWEDKIYWNRKIGKYLKNKHQKY